MRFAKGEHKSQQCSPKRAVTWNSLSVSILTKKAAELKCIGKINTKGLRTSLCPNFFLSSNYFAKKYILFQYFFSPASSANFILWNWPCKKKVGKWKCVDDMTEFARHSSTPEKMCCKSVPPELSPRNGCTWFVTCSSSMGKAVCGCVVPDLIASWCGACSHQELGADDFCKPSNTHLVFLSKYCFSCFKMFWL